MICCPASLVQITANHALGDCYAMGGSPRTALALAVVPFGPEAKMEEELSLMMEGALAVRASECNRERASPQ